MKKHFYLLLFFFAITLCSQAQIKKGDILLGGTIDFTTQKTNPAPDYNNISKQSSVDFNPSIGRAIKDNLVAGIDLIYSGSGSTQGMGTISFTNSYHSYGAGFFLRRYIPLGSGFAVFMQSRLGGFYNIQKTGYQAPNTPYSNLKGYTVDLSFYPGIAYAITKRVQLETGFANLVDLTYSHSKSLTVNDPTVPVPPSYKTNSFSLQTSLSNNYGFAVGIRVLLGS